MEADLDGCFTLLKNVDTTHAAQYQPIDGGFTTISELIPGTFSVRWPNGVPCTLVEMYLIHRFQNGSKSNSVDGGSLRATVAKLSHLVRFCGKTKIDFWNLDDDSYHRFICALQKDRKPRSPLVPKRNGNTIQTISAACVDFLRWLQDELCFRADLVGYGNRYRIQLKRPTKLSESESRSAGSAYHRLPPRDIREPKRPMPSAYRDSLWEAAQIMSSSRRISPAWAVLSQDKELLADFLKSRRELLLYLLEATGARPGELAQLSVLANSDCYKSRKLKLITLKRRRTVYRIIDIQPDVAMRLEVFIIGYRATLLDRIRQETGAQAGGDRVFVGVYGEPLHERTMTTEFSRISAKAGLSNVQSCMSMFRHRFITKQVALHLKEYLSENSLVRALMTEVDYLSILKKVTTITGHGSPQSLLNYIDLAWDELGAFDRVAAAQDIEAAIDSTITRLISLVGSASAVGSDRTGASQTIAELRMLQAEVQKAVAKSRGAAEDRR